MGMMCLKRMQDIDGVDDGFCVECWCCESPVLDTTTGTRVLTSLADYYADRDECFEENVVSEEEFDGIEATRRARKWDAPH